MIAAQAGSRPDETIRNTFKRHFTLRLETKHRFPRSLDEHGDIPIIVTRKMATGLFSFTLMSGRRSVAEENQDDSGHARMSHSSGEVTIIKMWPIRILMAVFVAFGVTLAGESIAGGPLVPVSTTPTLPGSNTGKPAAGMFLVARRTLDDLHFGRSVVYLVEHDENGTLGLIVNRPGDISLSEVLPDIEDEQATEHALHYGGPVGLSMILMLMRSESATEGMEHVANDVYISAEARVLDELLAAKKPASEVRFYIGHSGWAPGQLDFELERGSWLVVAADTNALFSSGPDSLWEKLIEPLEPRGLDVVVRPSFPVISRGAPDLNPG